MPTLPDAAPAPAAPAPRPYRWCRRLARCLLGALLALFALSVLFTPGDRIHWRAAAEAIEKATRADSVEVWDRRRSAPPDDSFRTVSDPGAIAAALREIRRAPGAWKPGRFKEPAGDLFLVFQQRTKHPPGDEPVLLLRLVPGFLIHGSGGHWEYKSIAAPLAARLAALGRAGAGPR